MTRRLLLVTQNFPPDRGGIEGFMGSLAESLLAQGHAVEVFADRIRSGAPETGIAPIHRFGGPRPLRRLRKRWAIGRALRRGQFDGVIVDSWKSVEALPATALPLLVLAHGMEFPLAMKASKAARIRRALDRARAVAANSRFTGDRVRRAASEGARVEVINLPIPAQPEPGPGDVAAVRAMLGPNRPVILTVARLEPRKGIDRVIAVLPDLLGDFPELVYVVAGRGEDRARLEQLARDRGVADRVHFAGGVEDGVKAALFQAADIFAMPARQEGASVEGFGLVFLEAAWHGLPSLAGSGGGQADAVQDGETGLLCDADDPAAVEAGLRRLLADAALRRSLGEAAQTRVRTQGTWSAALPRYLKLLFGWGLFKLAPLGWDRIIWLACAAVAIEFGPVPPFAPRQPA